MCKSCKIVTIVNYYEKGIMEQRHKIFAGPRVRRIRRERGLSQVRMASELGFSTSYLNLVERDQRPVSAQFLLRLAEVYDLDLSALAGNAEARAFSDLKEILADPLFDNIAIPRSEMQDLAGASPAIGDAMTRLYKAFKDSKDRATELSIEQIDPDGSTAVSESTSFPADEVRDFLQNARNYFSEIDEAAELLHSDLALSDGNIFAQLKTRLDEVSGYEVRIMPHDVLPDTLRRFDPHRRQLMISEMLSPPGRNFQLAYAIGMIEYPKLVDRAVAAGKFRDEESKRFARVSLFNYFAGALLMPYGLFRKNAVELNYDIEHLGQRFGTSFEQTCHRLTTLQRPGDKGIPFFFIRVDNAGNVSKRYASGSFHFSRFGGTCPVWNVHDCFSSPRKINSQIIQMPDDTIYFSVTRTVESSITPYGDPKPKLAIALACEIRYARAMIYSKGYDLENPEASPVGPTCRLCERPNCAQRALPPLARKMVTDERSRGISAYSFSEE